MISDDLHYKLHQVKVSNGNTCAVHQMYSNNLGKPVLMIHGAVENSAIFFSKNGKGFAPFLARNGFNVFVLDLPGKGSSIPLIKKGFKASMFDFIIIDLKLIIECLKSQLENNADKIIGVGHSWGGVLLLSFYAKYAKEQAMDKFIFFGTKKNVIINSIGKFFRIIIGLQLIARILNYFYGYLPVKEVFKIGIENEPYHFIKEINSWVSTNKWVDNKGFNYAKEFKKQVQPKILSIIAENDKFYGEKGDCINTLNLCHTNLDNVTFMHLSKKEGFLKDYDHNDMLSSKKAIKDHFPKIIDWINNN